MRGREEHDRAIEARVARRLAGAPQFLIDYSYNFTDKTARTREEYVKAALYFVDYVDGGLQGLKSLGKSDINRYMESVRIKADGHETSVSYRNQQLAAIRHFLNFMVEEGYMVSNPALMVKRARGMVEREVVALTPDEIRKLRCNIDLSSSRFKIRDKALIMLGLTTGLRCSSITEIDISDIDFMKNTIRVVEKGNKLRHINIGSKTMDMIKLWIVKRSSENDALFVSSTGRRMSETAVRQVVGKYTADLTKHITPHKLRSSCATNLYEQTGDIYLVQRMLGHADPKTTMRYARISDRRQLEAAEIMNSLF